jgi:thioesterase domain-containing protein
MRSDASLGWGAVVKGHLEIRELPGHQQNILTEPKVTRLAQELGERLEAQGEDTLPEPAAEAVPSLVG